MKYQYRARNQKGEFKSGIIEAPSKEKVVSILQQQGFIITGLDPIESAGAKKEIKIFGGKVKPKDLVFFFKQLSVLFSANVPLVDALNALAKQTKNSVLAEQILKVAASIDGGMSLSEALAQYPKTFSSFTVNMVKTGEVAGTLGKVLEQLADHIERDYLLTSKIKGAMYYPAFVVGAVILVIIVMLVFVLPQMTGMLKELGAELPLPTQIVINVSNFVIDNGLMILVLLVGIGFGLFRYFKTPNGKSLKDKIEVKIPVIGPLFQNIYLARIAENLGSLIKSGIPIVEALDTISLVIGNTLYEDVLKKARDNVRKGGTISEVFKDSSVIPSTLSQMVTAGESSGNLDKVLMSLAKFYNTEVDTTVENLMSLLEPILMVGLGLGVGFIAAAVLLPMYNLSGAM